MAIDPPTAAEQAENMSREEALEVVGDALAEIEAQEKEAALEELAKEADQQSDRWNEQCVLQTNINSLSQMRKQYQRDYQYIEHVFYKYLI